MLEGFERLIKQGKFTKCQASIQALEQYKIESDSVSIFINETGYKVSTENEIKLQDLFNQYRIFCSESGYKSCSLKTFADRLRNLGFQTVRKNYGNSINAEKKEMF